MIVGASFGGDYLTRQLQELDPKEVLYEILLIDKSEHFENITENYKMLTKEGIFEQNTIKFDQAIKSYRSDRVTFKQGCLKDIDPVANTVSF